MFKNAVSRSGGMGRGGGGQGQGRGKGGGNKPGAGPTGNCLCPKCGFTVEHITSQRCIDQTCPKCGAQMVRE